MLNEKLIKILNEKNIKRIGQNSIGIMIRILK